MNEPTKQYEQYDSVEPLEFDYHRYWGILRKRWAIIVTSFLLISVVASVYTLNLPDYYMATAKISFMASRPQQANLYRENQQYYDFTIYNPLFLKNQIAIILSDRVLTKAALRTGMIKQTDLANLAMVEGQLLTMRHLLSIAHIEGTSIVRITARGEKAQLVFDVSNAVAKAFIHDNLARQIEGYESNLSWLTDQMLDLEKKLENAQQKVIEFVERENLTGLSQPGQTVSKEDTSATGISSKLLSRLRMQKLELELKRASLQEKYLPAYPKLVAVNNELKTVRKKISREQQKLSKLRKKLDKKIIRNKQKEIQYDILTSKVDNYKQIYNTMVRKFKELDIGSSVVKNNVSLIEEARLPLVPAGPNKKKRIFYSLIGALIFSLGLALIIDYLDNSLRSSEEAESFLKLPVLATIPLVKSIVGLTESSKEGPLLASLAEDTQLREAFRTLRTNLRFSMPAKSSHSILVTSTGKGEGKSTVAANYALTCAESGKKTIIIDCDLRIPVVHKIFQVDNSVGLSNFLAESTPLEQLIQVSDMENLEILPSGPEAPKPTTLLESDNMLQLIPVLCGSYEVVILDAPPVGMVIDTSVIASLASGILMVLEAEKTNRYHIVKAIHQLNKSNAQVHGLVLNKLRLNKKQYLSYYGYYYQQSENRT